MPKKLNTGKLRDIARQFSEDGIQSDGSVLRCNVCEVSITIDEKHQRNRITQHVGSAKHVKNKELQCSKNGVRQQFIGEAFASSSSENKNDFFNDTAKTFVACGIPLSKLNNPVMKVYLQKYTGKSIPDESTLRKSYLQPLHEEKLKQIRQVVGENPVYFILDETTDRQMRYVLNILVAPLNGKQVKPMLLKTCFLNKTNNASVMQSFNNACVVLWPDGIEYDRVWLVLTDQASYMLLAIANLKPMYSNLRHVTCIAHALHRVCEAIKDEYSYANEFLSCIKKLLKKAPARIQKYVEVTGLPLPISPILTRWGTWLKAAVFICNNFKAMCDFLYEIPNDSLAVKKARELAGKQELQDELFIVHGYSFLTTAITRLEEQCLEKDSQWTVLMDVKKALEGIGKQKLEQSLAKNPDVEDVATNKDLNYRLLTKYAPLVSVDVERSFSTYKYLLSDRRCSLSEKNIEILNIICFNSFLDL